MAQYTEGPTRTFVASAALDQFLRVVDNGSSQLALAGAHQACLGTMEEPTFASGDPATVRLRSAAGTRKMVAAGTITAHAKVYAAAGGKVSATGTVLEGVAMGAASGDGSVLEVLPLPGGGLNLEDVKTVAATGSTQGDAAALTGVVNVVTAGDDAKGVVLPAAAAGAGLVLVLNSGAAGLKIYPATGDKINNGSENAAITILENTLAMLVATAADNWGATYTVNS